MSPITLRYAELSPAALNVLSHSGEADRSLEKQRQIEIKNDKNESPQQESSAELRRREDPPPEQQEQTKTSIKASVRDSPPEQQEGLQLQPGDPETDPLGPIAELCADTMNLDAGDALSYARSLDRWRVTIRRIAELFLKIASPTELLLSPRYDHSARPEGLRLHPLKVHQAAIQQLTGTPHAVWQPVKRAGRRQNISFDGLDVYLLADVSGSMEGEKAHCAADTALCLIEGLQLASYMAHSKNEVKHPGTPAGRTTVSIGSPPDVRIELTAFGEDFDIVCPLSYQPSGEQKGKVFFNLRNAGSKGTCISGALNNISRSAQSENHRKKIIFIISDGRFHDPEAAAQAAQSLLPIAKIKQVFIGETGTVISDFCETIASPLELPEKLYELLRDQAVNE
jgi:hypothetical protein